jgi:hypothetical protein
MKLLTTHAAKLFGCVSLIACASFALFAQQGAQTANSVRTTALEIVDKDGRVVARLGANEELHGVSLTLGNGNGKGSVELFATDDGVCGLHLYGKDEADAGSLIFQPDIGTAFSLERVGGHGSLDFWVGHDGKIVMNMTQSESNYVLLTSAPDSDPQLIVSGTGGKSTRLSFVDGNPRISIADENGSDRACMSMNRGSGATLSLHSADGRETTYP